VDPPLDDSVAPSIERVLPPSIDRASSAVSSSVCGPAERRGGGDTLFTAVDASWYNVPSIAAIEAMSSGAAPLADPELPSMLWTL